MNKAGSVVGAFTPVADQVSTDTLAPYRCETTPGIRAAQATVAAHCLHLLQVLALAAHSLRN